MATPLASAAAAGTTTITTTPPCVILAPMVRGSELAFRMLCCAHGACEAWSPMLRARDVLTAMADRMSKCGNDADVPFAALTAPGSAAKCPLTTKDRLFLPDTCPADRANLVVQICGSDPSELARATTAILWAYPGLKGIDLNLGCPQVNADKEHFGAFLVERDPDLAVACVLSMSQAADEHARTVAAATTATATAATAATPPPHGTVRVSAKMRLLDDVEAGIAFARRLVREARLDMLTVHCRHRTSKHDGPPNLDDGKALVDALDIPVIINGGVSSAEAARHILRATGAAGVMAARGFLRNPRMLREEAQDVIEESEKVGERGSVVAAAAAATPNVLERMCHNPAYLAAEYLEFCERFPPPSTLYIRKHLRWIFREELQPAERYPDAAVFRDPVTGWRARLWTFLARPYINSLDQFRQIIGLYSKKAGVDPLPASIARLPAETFSFKAIRNKNILQPPPPPSAPSLINLN